MFAVISFFNPKVYNDPPLIPILSQINPVHMLISSSSTTYFNTFAPNIHEYTYSEGYTDLDLSIVKYCIIIIVTRNLCNVNDSSYLTSRHRRVWKAMPPPQEREQSLGSDHGPQLPESGDTAAPPSTTKLPGRYVCGAA